jgi:hypothetical protein
MKVTRIFLAICLLATLWTLQPGCATGPYLASSSREARPAWLERVPFKKGERRFYIGRSSGARDAESAYELARADAVRALVQELGVTVSEESTAIQQEHNGEFNYDIELKVMARAAPVKVRNMSIADRFHESWERAGPEVDAWILMSVPETDFRRALREAAGKVLVIWECQAQPRPLCSAALAGSLREIITRSGKPLLPGTVLGGGDSLAETGIKKEAAYVFHVAVSATFIEEIEGEFFANGSATAQLIDTGENKILTTVETGTIKGGHFSQDQAVEKALTDTIKALADKLRDSL